MLRIGVISDTHNFLDPKIPELFTGVDHILHAGDIGQPRLILQLEQIAPVTAVLGNTDNSGLHYQLTEAVELADYKFLVHHIVDPHAPDETVQRLLDREKPAIVVFGHTHKQFSETIGSTLFFNPGYAGKSRFGMPRSVAILHITGKGIRSEFLPLGDTVTH